MIKWRHNTVHDDYIFSIIFIDSQVCKYEGFLIQVVTKWQSIVYEYTFDTLCKLLLNSNLR